MLRYESIQFTKEQGMEGKWSFLDIQIIQNQDGSLGRTAYRKPTHTDVYLHKRSHHHPAQKMGIMTTLINKSYC